MTSQDSLPESSKDDGIDEESGQNYDPAPTAIGGTDVIITWRGQILRKMMWLGGLVISAEPCNFYLII